MNFIDWIGINQIRIPGTLPLVGSEFRVSTSLETGELVKEQVIGFRHEGSFDSSLHIRSDGTTVSVSGNPSAFDRPDNLFGWHSVYSAVEHLNRQVDAVGLPEFDSIRDHEELKPGSTVTFRATTDKPRTKRDGLIPCGAWTTQNGRQSAHQATLLNDGRARISRLDITENIATNGACDFIRHLSSYVHHGKAGFLYPNGQTVDWGGSRRVYTKYYVPAHKLAERIKELRKHIATRNAERIAEHLAYLERLKTWCDEHQIVRRETSIKSTELIDRQLIYIESWSDDTMTNVIRPYQFHKKLNIEETRFTGIAQVLEDKGIPVRQARQAEMIHTSWVNGGDVKALCGSKTTFHRYRRMLLGLGVDIANPCDISRITLRAHRGEWHEVAPPSWYVLPGEPATSDALKRVA